LRDALSATSDDNVFTGLVSFDKSKLLSSGFVPLNLACTNSQQGFIAPGGYCVIFGDSESGKTWLHLQILAEAANNTVFDDYA
jgi:hypothetical protein